MTDLANLAQIRIRKNENRVDLDRCVVFCSAEIIDVDGNATGATLDVSIRTDDSRLSSGQKTTLKNVVKNIGQIVLGLE